MDYFGYHSSAIMHLFIMHGESNKIISRTCLKFNEQYPELPCMTRKKFRKLQSLFSNGDLNEMHRNRNKPITGMEDNEITVLAYFYQNPHASIRSAANDLGLSYYAIQHFLKKHKMHAFSLKPVQQLLPEDPLLRIQFGEFMLSRIQEDERFLQNIIWTDECSFDKEGIFNRKNEHYWATENPHFPKARNFQQRFRVNVFCLMKDNRISYTIYQGNLNSERYLNILRTTVQEFLDELPLNELRHCWYQLDGAPAHSGVQIEGFLDNNFEDRWIGRFGPWRWPPRSPDLTPLDFFCGGL